MQIEGRNWFPYLPPSWLNRLVELVRLSVPRQVDVEWCVEGHRFTFTRQNASQFVSQLRMLGWIDENGAMTAQGRNLRLRGDNYAQFMRQELARIYDELEGAIEDAEFDADRLETYFTSASSMGLSGRRKIVSTYRWFLTEAGLSDAAERLGRTTVAPRARQTRQTRQPRPTARAVSVGGVSPQTPRRADGAGAAAHVALSPGLPNITLSISLQLPAVDDERVYEAIFKAMREHLFGQQPVGEGS